MSQPQDQQQQLSVETALRPINDIAAETATAQEVGQVEVQGQADGENNACATALEVGQVEVQGQADGENNACATALEVAQVEVQEQGETCASGSGGAADGGCGLGATQLGVLLSSSGPGQSTQDSVHSADEFGNYCRICFANPSDMELITCPCKCKGSVGYIHLKCLKRWIMSNRGNCCEICNAPFNITADRASVKQMVRAFCCGRCCGMIVKHILFSASLMPLAHVILQQVLHCMDNLNQGSTEQLTVQEVSVASCALLTSSGLFFHFFEFVTTRFLLIRNILRHWWMFGSTTDYGLVEVEDDAFDLF